MGSAQSSYGDMPRGFAGSPAYGSVFRRPLSRACETAAGIDFGKVVSKGASDKGCIIGGSVPLGIALRDHGQGMDVNSAGKYVQKSMVSILDKDFVLLETMSTSGAYRAKVYYDTVTGSIVVTDSPTGTQKIIGYLGQTLTAAGLVIVYVDTSLFYMEADVLAIAEGSVQPGQVTTLAATVANAQSVVSWVDPVGVTVDRVVVQVSTTSSGLVGSTRNAAAGAGTVTVTSLSNGTGYTISVWVVDSLGNTGKIATVTVTPSAG